jgi:hypothetical protein
MYNMIPNLLWSLINLIPIAYFCYNFLPRNLLYIFLGVSLAGYLLPTSFYKRIQIRKLKFLKRAGVPLVQRYAQNGTIINRIIRKKIPQYKLNYDRKTMEASYKRTYEYEKFHFVALIFFLLTTVFALTASYYVWSLILTVTNIIYNVYPILLQHYTRLRISSLLQRKR